MSISMEYCYSSLAAAKVLSDATVLLSLVVRWLLLPWYCLWPASLSSSASFLDETEGAESRARHSVAAQAVRDNLNVSTYGELVGEGDEAGDSAARAATCAVCLSEVRRRDSVWELRNCRHVFHKGCLDRWLDHDEHLTCPLCRLPLLGELARLPCASAAQASSEPSWAVERLLYLFGDDVLFAPAC